MLYKRYFVATLLFSLAACTRFEDAEMTERSTFVHFYSSADDYHGVVGELDADGGYILSGEIRNDDGTTNALIVKTDDRGHKQWEKIIPAAIINAIKPAPNGYILVGDSIKLNPGSPDVNELENTYARLLLMDLQGNILEQHITKGTVRRTVNNQPMDLNIDYHGDAFTVDPTGNILVLGSFRVPGELESTFVSAFSPGDISAPLWYRSYVSRDNDYINCNALHLNPSFNLVWATKTSTQGQNNVAQEFLSVSHVAPNSTYIGNSPYGESDSRNHAVSDIQRSGVGFGVIGTYAETNGLNANIYFVRTGNDGIVIKESARYIDGEALMRDNTVMEEDTKTTSVSFDEGTAIIATDDGWVLAGSMTTTPAVGNGGKDILLVKLDAVGNLVWKKLIGGSGDETVRSIRVTPDDGFLLCGTNTVNGLSTMMLMKTDSNGELNK